jgi:hypothetical protein
VLEEEIVPVGRQDPSYLGEGAVDVGDRAEGQRRGLDAAAA